MRGASEESEDTPEKPVVLIFEVKAGCNSSL